MEDEDDQPNEEREYASGQSKKHQPTQHAESVKKMSVILSVHYARMHRAFVDMTAIRVRHDTARNYRSNWRHRKQNDQGEKNPVKNPREPFSSERWGRWIHCQ